MPFKSTAQRAWMHANIPDIAQEWEKYLNQKNLPEKVKKKKSKMRKRMKAKRT